MRPKKPKKADHDDLFRARLDQIINLRHELVLLADKIDWDWLDDELASSFSDQGRPAEPVRFMIGMFLLKATITSRMSRCGSAGCTILIFSILPARHSSSIICRMNVPA